MDTYPTDYVDGCVLLRLDYLRSTPHILASLAVRETNPFRI